MTGFREILRLPRTVVCLTEDKVSSDEFIMRCAELFAGDAAAGRQIIRPKMGKPRFDGCEGLSFSVSHSGGLTCCAVSRDEVGFDIQQTLPDYRFADIARRFFSDAEHETVTSVGCEEQIQRFYRIWTAKEAYVKLDGEGVVRGFRAFSVVSGDGHLLPEVNGRRLIPVTVPQGYLACLCILPR